MAGVGTYTFLFTDIEGSTRLLQTLKDGYRPVLEEHHRLIREAIAAEGGEEIGTEGDSFFVLFTGAGAAARAAVAAQLALTGHAWPDGVELRVRMGLHTGEAHRVPGDVVGLAVHRAARIGAAAHGGQVLVSSATAGLLADALPDATRLGFLGPHHLKDFDVAEELFQLSHDRLVAEFPPPRTEAASPTNLPTSRTSFVGREEELRAVSKLLGEARLVTLMGAGGAGKTRLAQEAAAGVLAEFPDGVWWVDLAPVADPELVAQEAAAAVGLQEGSLAGNDASGPMVDRLVAHLRVRRVLLVLDNCEHLIDACAAFAEAVLRSCPQVRLLATSREPLGVEGETTRRVPSLPVPVPDATPEDLAASEAVRLFRDRAAAVRDDFDPTGQELLAVAQVCRRLDGIPLAIELAAARVRSLSCAQIAERLDDRFRLLTGGSRTALPRQRTLEALVDWSHDLLSEPERVLLRRLSVFSGGFFLEAAEAVCSGEGVDEFEVVDLCARLVDKSLVAADHREEGTRYGMLETMRQYGREKLLASGEVEALRMRHLRYYADLAETQGQQVNGGPEQLRTLDRFEAEHDNFRTALEWALSGGDHVEDGLRLAAGLGWFWWIRGHLGEGQAWLRRVLERSGEICSLARAECLTFAVFVDVMRSRFSPESEAFLDEALGIARAQRGMERRAYAESLVLWLKGILRRLRDGSENAEYEEGLAVASEGGVRLIEGAILQSSAIDAYQRGEYEIARQLCEESLAVARAGDHRVGIIRTLNTLATVAQAQGDLERARAVAEEALPMARDLGDRIGVWLLLSRLVGIVRAAGQYRQARVLAEELLVFSREWGEPSSVADAWYELGLTHLMMESWGEGRNALENALSVSRQMEESPHPATILLILAELERVHGDLDAARRHTEEGLEIVRRASWPDGEALLLVELANILRCAGEGARARVLLSEALSIGISGVYVSAVLEGLGILATDEAAWEVAARLLGAAEGLRPADWFEIPGDTELASALARCREALGPRFEELFEAGRAMSREDALREARVWLEAGA